MPRIPLARAALAGLGTLAVVAAAVQPVSAAPRAERAEGPVAHAFSSAAAEYGVPRDLLIALGYSETHLDGHHGLPSQAGGYGVMHLVSNPDQHTLELASRLTGDTARELRTDTAANIRGGAAVLRSYADHAGLNQAERRDTDTWYPLLARYGGVTDPATARLYADTVYTFLAKGVTARAEGGEKLTLPARKVAPERGSLGASLAPAAQSPDYPSALWVPANAANYAVGRTAAISKVVIHVTEGSYAGTISWFQNPSAQVSAHYVVRSSDGQITQMVREKDTAWHARSGNATGVGIEHEGYIDNPSWFTDAMYRSSAALTASICARYGIPKDRAHIVGHSEVPGNDHTDPGPNWNWTYYMQLVGGSTGGGEVQLSFPSYDTLRSGSTGAQVSAAQSLLNAAGFDAGTVDGSFGTKTTSAVSAFQKARGLGADGVVGARTWTALLSAGTTPALSQGSTGAAVQRLQRALTAALGRTITADGDFGSGTQQAVRDYQTSRSLGVDGQVGPATWGALQAGR
ncbi:N-acetylmuramoyl-L-alanine amidase [Streptomyces bauhiniae]|uniref:N-acetylmuramoyl-L-alanine amidase n=1 Tax=Streptomyces bauhiniae TaxID=2340725 RepID=A0A7K3QTI4_9ACTN|nr:N-acetylmuramoyl-L-alanine amidase [Streptomyces bauhiniae]NEB93202.1 N-acetylmuramoyl-L-alanine amidase [Streptomyces bauhiniae]